MNLMSVKGIDISNNNGTVDISALKSAGYSFLIAKATEETSFTDSYYISNIQTAKKIGMLTGAYHFARFTDIASATEEASHFKSIVLQKLPDFLALDIEYNDASGDLTLATNEFMSSIAEVGIPTLFYSYPEFIKEHYDTTIQQYNLWIADFDVSEPDIYCWNEYSIWQYTDDENGLDADNMTDSFYDLITNTSVEENDKMDNIVIYGNEVDKRAAEYLADYLKCPTIDGNIEYDYSNIQNIYCIGGAPTIGWTSYATKIITGSDRYDTVKQVLAFIGKI